MGVRHALERSRRPPVEAARPPCPDDCRAGRQHEQGGHAPQYNTTRHFQINRRLGRRTIVVRLLERSSHGVEPNAYGRALLNGGVAAFDDLRQALKNIEFLAESDGWRSADWMYPLTGRELRYSRYRSALPALSAHGFSSGDGICGNAAP